MHQRLSSLTALAAVAIMVLGISGCKDEENPVTPQSPHFQPEGLVILTDVKDTVVYYFQGVVRPGDTLKAPPGNNLSAHWTLEFLGSGGQKIAYPSTELYRLGWSIADQSIAELFRHQGEEWEFHLRGKAAGTTTLTFRVLHEDHADFTTRPFPVLVDSSVHGEAAGFVLVEEESGDTLVIVRPPGITVEGSLAVRKDSTSDHAVAFFFDDTGRAFQPAVPPHALGFAVGDASIASIVPPSPEEPWAIRLVGISAGTTEIVFKLLADGTPEWSTPGITITVSP